MKKSYLLIIILFGFFSCEKVIPFEGDVTIPKLVINSIFESDSSFKVHVSSSKSVIDTAQFQNIFDASVRIEDENGNLIDELQHESNGFYIGQQQPTLNQNYFLKVEHPNYSNVNASDSLPSPIYINSIDTVTSPNQGFESLDITLNFNDPVNTTNYYLVEAYVYNFYMEYEEYIIVSPTGTQDTLIDTLYYEEENYQQTLILADEVFQNKRNSWEDQGLFNDLVFNGQTKSLQVSIPKFFLEEEYNYQDGNTYYEGGMKKIRFYLHNISLPYFYFRTSLQAYDQTSGSPFAQPVQVYSNIENGFGIFAGAQVSYIDLID